MKKITTLSELDIRIKELGYSIASMQAYWKGLIHVQEWEIYCDLYEQGVSLCDTLVRECEIEHISFMAEVGQINKVTVTKKSFKTL